MMLTCFCILYLVFLESTPVCPHPCWWLSSGGKHCCPLEPCQRNLLASLENPERSISKESGLESLETLWNEPGLESTGTQGWLLEILIDLENLRSWMVLNQSQN